MSLLEIEQLCRSQALAVDAGLDRTRASEGGFLGGTPPHVAAALRAGALAGEPLSAMFRQLGLVDELSLAIMGAAEERGDIAGALNAIADRCAERRSDQQALLKKLVYPAMLLLAGILIPPLPSLVNGGVPAYLGAVTVPLFVLLGVAVLANHVRKASPNDPVRRAAVGLVTVAPPLAKITLLQARARFTEVLGACLRAGLDMRAGITWASRTADHVALGAAAEAIARIQRGSTLPEALSSMRGLDAQDLSMISQGEVAGALDTVLPRIAKLHHEAARQATFTLIRVSAGVITAGVMAKVAYSIVTGYLGILRQTAG